MSVEGSEDAELVTLLQRCLDDMHRHDIQAECRIGVHVQNLETYVEQNQPDAAVSELEDIRDECPLYAYDPAVAQVARQARSTIRDINELESQLSQAAKPH